jgi:hypothetical protein
MHCARPRPPWPMPLFCRPLPVCSLLPAFLWLRCRSFFALNKSAAAAAIAGVIGVNPSVVASQNAEGQNPLHYVLSLRHQRHAYGQQLGYANPGELLAVIRVLLSASADAAKARDGQGRFPLQVALSRANSLVVDSKVFDDIILALLEAHPEATRVEPLALHTALCKLKDVVLINTVLAAYPGAVAKADADGMLPFHLALLRPDVSGRHPSSLALALLKAYPAAAAVKCPAGATYSGLLPLVVALCERAPADLIDLLLQEHPQALRVPCSVARVSYPTYDGFPLHIALVSPCDPSCVIKVVEAWPKACQERNRSGMFPLELALRYTRWAHQPNASVVLAVLRGWSKAARQPLQHDAQSASNPATGSGWLPPPQLGYPLHQAAAMGATAAIEAILKAWPAAAADRDYQSKLPLQLLLEETVEAVDEPECNCSALWSPRVESHTRAAAWAHVPHVARLLIDAAPTPPLPLPLHLVLSYGETSKVPPRMHRQLISDLVRGHPEAVRVPMEGHRHPVHQALRLQARARDLASRISVPAGSLPGESFSTCIDGVETTISVPPDWKEGMDLLIGVRNGSQDAIEDLVPDDLIRSMLETDPQACLHHSTLQLAIRRRSPSPVLIRAVLQAQPAAVKAIALSEVLAAGLSDEILALFLAADLSGTPWSMGSTDAGPHVSGSKHFVAAMFEPRLRGAIRLLLSSPEADPGGLGFGRHARALLCAALPSAEDFLAHIVSSPTASPTAAAATSTVADAKGTTLRRSKRSRSNGTH